MSILNITVSCYRNYSDPIPNGEITLLKWLQSSKLKGKVDAIRITKDKKTRNTIKATLPAITPSGTFSYRNEISLVRYSGFVCLDIDLEGNERISNYAALKNEMAKIKQVAYCGLSVSGQGYFLLIPLAYPEKHLQHFYALQLIFQKFGIKIDDKCKDVSRLRGYSYDPDAYFNHFAIPFKALYTPTVKTSQRTIGLSKPTGDNAELVETLLIKIEHANVDITADYNYWFSIGCNFAATFGECGREYFHRASQFHSDYNTSACNSKFNSCLKKVNNLLPDLGSFINRCKEYGF